MVKRRKPEITEGIDETPHVSLGKRTLNVKEPKEPIVWAVMDRNLMIKKLIKDLGKYYPLPPNKQKRKKKKKKYPLK